MINLGFKKVNKEAKLPTYAHAGDAGMDVYAAEDVELKVGIPTIVKTGLVCDIPDGYEIQVRPRSGLSLKGVTVWNSPGTIDAGYRNEIGVILVYLSKEDSSSYNILKGDRIAQFVVAPTIRVNPVEIEKVSGSDRGMGGFGSTGV